MSDPDFIKIINSEGEPRYLNTASILEVAKSELLSGGTLIITERSEIHVEGYIDQIMCELYPSRCPSERLIHLVSRSTK